jgi:hypothetical protein
MFEGMDRQLLMTLENHQIMAVSFMISEEEILAMDGIYILPVFQSKFDRRKRRMGVKLIFQTMLLKMAEHFVYSCDSCHLFRLLA